MTDISPIVTHCVKILQETEEYLEYAEARRRIDEQPKKRERLDEYRHELFAAQLKDNNTEELFNLDERMHEKYADVFADSDMVRFFDAETSFCRLVQTLQTQILEGVDFN